jgi:hypothetical protein
MAGKPNAETAIDIARSTNDPWAAFEYEVEMFYETRARFNLPDLETAVRNALVESSLLHTRILVEALLNRRRKREDVILKTLLNSLPTPPTPDELAKLDQLAPKLGCAFGCPDRENDPHRTLNKRLAHLTSVRATAISQSRTASRPSHRARPVEVAARRH